MPHQAVEIVRRGGAHVGLQIDHLRLVERGAGQRIGGARGLFERGSVGHVHDHLELALVVERQHLDFDELEVDQRDGAEQQEHDAAQESPAQRRPVQDGAHHAAVQAREAVLLFAVGAEPWLGFRIRTAAHGVTTKATSSEKTIAALAPIGMGRM